MAGKASVDTEVTQTSHTSQTLILRAWGAEEETEEALRGARVPRPSQCGSSGSLKRQLKGWTQASEQRVLAC